ncbi:MAG: ribonuclease P protein component [Bdellovibrionaceae bacterium]|nr:ribonuclease P protein component [Pseudobdellovibrionaceae bacterium]
MENNVLVSLRRNSDFLALRRSGKKVRANDFLLFVFSKNNIGCFRLGITVGSRVANAVQRNRIKRVCREFFRYKIKFSNLSNLDLNVVFQKKDSGFYKDLSNTELKSALEVAFKKLCERIKNND